MNCEHEFIEVNLAGIKHIKVCVECEKTPAEIDLESQLSALQAAKEAAEAQCAELAKKLRSLTNG